MRFPPQLWQEPEPGKEEIFEYSMMSRWLSLYGIHSYRIRVSGHYYPFEIGEILRLNKFKKILPIIQSIQTSYCNIRRLITPHQESNVGMNNCYVNFFSLGWAKIHSTSVQLKYSKQTNKQTWTRYFKSTSSS
jgi:hypothetical protein